MRGDFADAPRATTTLAGNEFGIGGPSIGVRRTAGFYPALAAAVAAGALLSVAESPGAGSIVFVSYLVAGAVGLRAARWRWLLPMAGVLSALVVPLVGILISAGALAIAGVAAQPTPQALAAALALACFLGGAKLVAPRVRVGVVGSPMEAVRLAAEIQAAGGGSLVVEAVIAPDDWSVDSFALLGPCVCSLGAVGRVIDERNIEILVVTGEFSRKQVDAQLFDELITRPVRVMALHEFHEYRFGAVPVAEISHSWFTGLAGRHHRPLTRLAKRCLDLALALALLVVLWPLLAAVALLIRRDGGPAIYRQQRIGKGGVPFTILKLRTMRSVPSSTTEWTVPGDRRVTSLGKVLRRTHIDELPQLWNVVRGDMSLVGPRPEQSVYVEVLSDRIPFYAQRHVVQPGITGWAQVRVGYQGTLEGTTFKLCNDLYYVKNHTLWLDLLILLETLRSLVASPYSPGTPPTRDTMLGMGAAALAAGSVEGWGADPLRGAGDSPGR